MKVLVKSVLAETELDAPPKSLFREIYVMICKSLGIQEMWYFGLFHQENPLVEGIWLDSSKKALRDLTTSSVTKSLDFRIKYHPEDVGNELIENITIQIFYLETKSAILRDELFCPADTAALLASYSLQIKHGDFDEEQHNEDFFSNSKLLLPERVIKQYDLDAYTWIESITNMWKKLNGMDVEDAMLEYLKLAQNLEMYGITYFRIKNRKGTPLLLGVNALGLDVYKPENQLTPEVSFPWSEIRHLTFRDTKFVIKSTDKRSPDFVFFTASGKCSKQILKLGVGNHQLYVRRRKQDPPEIVRMKEKANAVRELRRKHKDKLNFERTAREEAMRREIDYKQQLAKMKKELEESHRHLLEANRIIAQLQEQLRELQKAKDELEKEQQELKLMMKRLQDAKDMEAEEKLKLEREIREKQQLVQQIQNDISSRDEETRRLQEEVEAARKREEEFEAMKRQEEERRKEEEAKKKSTPELPESTQVNENLQESLKVLQNKLEDSLKIEEETTLDKIHRINVLEGRDKYKTLADIRRGNTVRRIEMFENM